MMAVGIARGSVSATRGLIWEGLHYGTTSKSSKKVRADTVGTLALLLFSVPITDIYALTIACILL